MCGIEDPDVDKLSLAGMFSGFELKPKAKSVVSSTSTTTSITCRTDSANRMSPHLTEFSVGLPFLG